MPLVMSKSAFAARCGVATSAVSNWISRGKLSGTALTADGQIAVEEAERQLAQSIDPGRGAPRLGWAGDGVGAAAAGPMTVPAAVAGDTPAGSAAAAAAASSVAGAAASSVAAAASPVAPVGPVAVAAVAPAGPLLAAEAADAQATLANLRLRRETLALEEQERKAALDRGELARVDDMTRLWAAELEDLLAAVELFVLELPVKLGQGREGVDTARREWREFRRRRAEQSEAARQADVARAA